MHDIEHNYARADSFPFTSIIDTPVDQLKRTLDVRFWGAVAAVKAAHAFLNARGSITLTSGSSGYRPSAGQTAILPLGGALETLVRGLAVDLAPIRVNLAVPGAIRTEFWDGLHIPPEVQTAFAEKSLVKRLGEAEDAAETYLYLMKADFVTGTYSLVEGGAVLA